MGHYEYTEILRTAMYANVRGYLIFAALILLVPIIDFVIGRTLLKAEKRSSKKWLIIWVIVGISFETFIYADKTLPIIKDIDSESYVCVHGEYYMYNFTYSADRDRDIQVKLDSGEVIQMLLPKRLEFPRIDTERFPVGRYTGTVWYAENSHYILEFIPDEPTDIS